MGPSAEPQGDNMRGDEQGLVLTREDSPSVTREGYNCRSETADAV
jgi:hypothetical protein